MYRVTNGGYWAQPSQSWHFRIRQTNTPSSGQTLDLWRSDNERTRKVLHDSYLSWHLDPKEQGPAETCSSNTTFNPTSDSSHFSLNGYDSLPNPCAKFLKTTRCPSAELTADPRAAEHESRTNTRSSPERNRTLGRFVQAIEADKIWEHNQNPRKTEKLCYRLSISFMTLTVNTL